MTDKPADPFAEFVSDTPAVHDGAPIAPPTVAELEVEAKAKADLEAKAKSESDTADAEAKAKADAEAKAKADAGKTDEEKAADATAADAKAKADAAAKPEDEDEDDKNLSDAVRKRIGKLTKNWRADQRRADELAGRLAAYEEAARGIKPDDLTKKPDDTKSAPKQPEPKDYKFGELDSKYITDLAQWSARTATAEALKESNAEADKVRQRDAANAELEKFAQKTKAMTKAGAEKYDDFEEVVIQGAADGKWNLSVELGQLVLGSEVGADITYHLASNPKFAGELFSQSPLEQAAAFGRLEAKFAKPAAPAAAAAKPSQAPTPPAHTAAGGGGKSTVRADTEDFSAFEAMAARKRE